MPRLTSKGLTFFRPSMAACLSAAVTSTERSKRAVERLLNSSHSPEGTIRAPWVITSTTSPGLIGSLSARMSSFTSTWLILSSRKSWIDATASKTVEPSGKKRVPPVGVKICTGLYCVIGLPCCKAYTTPHKFSPSISSVLMATSTEPRSGNQAVTCRARYPCCGLAM